MTEASAAAPTTRVITSGRFLDTAAQIAVIDTALSGWRDLQAGLPSGMEAVLIGESRDGVAAMAQALAGRQGVRALHVLCHGFEGGLQLGTARLDEAALTARAAELAAIGACLADDGDILLYGCNVASGHGESFLDALADITGAAMAASRTPTGAADLGGDWDLAWTRGTPRTEALRIDQYRGVLAAPSVREAVAYTGESIITITYDDELDTSSNPLLSHFVATDGTLNAGTGSILINGNSVALVSAVVSSNAVTLTVGHQFQVNDSIAFRYEDPAGDDLTGVIQASYGLDTVSVDVNVTVLTARPPALLSASAQIGTNKVVLSFDQALDANNPPSTQQFFGSSSTQGQIRINGVYYSVSSVAVVGSTVTVEVGNGYIFQNGDLVSLRYYDGDTVDSTTAIQNQAGVDIPDFRTSFTVQLNAPTVTATGNAPTFTQNAAPVDLFSGVTASTNTGQVFTSVTLTVTNVVDDEWLSIDGTIPISLSSPATGVTVPTIPGATLSTSHSGTTATVTLSGFSLTGTQLAALIDGIAYVNAGDAVTGIVTPGNRVISITSVTDDGSNNNTSTLSGVSSTVVVAAAAPPTLTATGNTNTFVTYTSPSDLFSTVTASTNDSGQVFTSLTLTVTGVLDSASEMLVFLVPGWSSSTIALNHGATSLPVGGVTASATVSGGTVTVTISGLQLSDSQMASFIDGIAYNNIAALQSATPSDGPRVITITGVTDDGSSDNSASLSGITATVNIGAPQAPVLQSAAVDGTSLVLTYDVALDSANPPAAGAFTVTAGGSPVTISGVAVDGANKTVTLTLAQAVAHGSAVTVSYTDPTVGDDVNAVQSAWGGIDAATVATQPVTNNTPNPNATPPTLTLSTETPFFMGSSGSSGFDLFNAVTASTVDGGQHFTGMVLKVYNVVGNGGTEFLTIGGSDITLSTGSGTFNNGSYAVTLANGVATVTLNGMSLSDGTMGSLIDGITYKNTGPANAAFGSTETRPIVLHSVTDSGPVGQNTTVVDQVATVTIANTMPAPAPLKIAPTSPTVSFVAGTPKQVSFTITATQSITLVGSMVEFGVSAPSGWTVANISLDMPVTGIITIGSVFTLTFDITASGTDTSGAFPISIVSTAAGIDMSTAAISNSVMVMLAPPAPVLQSATVDGTSLVLTYDAALDAVNGPAASAFEVKVGGSTVTVSNVAVNSVNKTVTLTLAQAVQHGQTVTVSYTDPTSGDDAAAIQNATGGADAATVTNQSVTNNTADTTPPSITNVTIPNQPAQVGDTVTVTITVASDSDTYTLGNGSTVGGFALANLTRVSATTYTATFTVTADGQRTGNLAANQDIPVNIVLVDSASNANTPYTTPISQNNDRIDTNAPPVLAVPTTPPTLVDTSATDTFPLIDGQLSATDLEGDTLTYSVAGSQASPVQHGSVTLSNGVTYDTWSTGPGGTAYVNSQTGHYAYVFDAAFLNGVPAGPMQGTGTFTVSDGNRTVEQQLTLNFTGANDSPILSNDVRSLAAIDQGIADAANTGTTVTALLASAGTATDAEYDSPFPLVTVLPLGIAVTGVTNTNGTWQYKVGTGAWTDIPTASSAGAALLLAGSDRVRFVPSGSGFTNTDTGGLTFKAWDLTSGSAGATADTTTADAYSAGSATATITVDAVPTLTATGGTTTFGVGVDGATTSLFSGVAASTVEAGQSFRGVVFTVSGVTDATEVLTIGGTDVALTNGATATLSGLGVAGGNAGVSVSVVGGVATVTVTGLERSDAQMSALLGGVTYKNTSASATLGDRTVAVASLTDSGGATGAATISGVSTVVSVADVTPPAAPVVTSAALTNSATPIIAGTAEADSTVTVTIGGATYTTTATNGSWSINLATATPASGSLSLNANGTNAVSVTARDASNNTSTAGTQTLTIDTTAPNAPAVTSAALSNSATPIIGGTAETGSTVTVTVGGATYTTTATNGTWSLNLATATPASGTLSLNANGSNAVSATATDAAGNVSTAGTQTLTIDTTAPNAPAVTSAALSNSATPTIGGTAETGSTVTVTIGGATYTTTATNGTWSLNLATATPASGSLSLNANGTNAVSATATDAAGNTSTAGTQTLTIDTTAPNAPTVTTALSNSTTPTLTGAAETGSTVTVTVGGATYTTTATNGTWSVNLATATPTAGSLSLNANGANPVSATATDAAGNISSAGTQTLTIDTTLPDAPTVTSAALSNSTTPTLTGTAETGSTVTVTIGGATYTTTASGTGAWSVNLATATPTAGSLSLDPNGANPVAATATDAAGNTSAPGTQTLTIDTTAPNAPAVTSATLTNSATPTLTGTAEAGSTVTVTVGGATYTTTATNGTWSLNLATATPTSGSLSLNANGTNTVSATATDAAGNTSTAGTQTLTIDTTLPDAPTVTSAALSNSTTPTLTGTAETGSTVTVTVGGATYTTTATNGTWSLNLATATPTSGSLSLNPNGANTVSATATDASGNVSAPGTQTLTIDTTLPDAPTVTTALTNSTTPTLTGTAEANATVTVTVGGATYTTTASGTGAWSLDLATATPTAGSLSLDPNGANPVAATATDAAGNVSSPATHTLTVDTTPPTASVLFDDDSIDAIEQSSTAFTISGGEAGAAFTWTITSAGGGQVSGSGVMSGPTAQVGGLDLSGLGDGTLTLTLALTDPAGNASLPFTATTQKLTATVDKPAPVAPPPVATVDGATVTGAVTTNGDGSRTTTVTIEASTGTRVEDTSTANPDLADVPVVREQVVDAQTGQVSTQTTLTVSVSTGVAVTATGGAERQTAAQALTGLTGLIAAIEARTDEGTAARSGLTGGGSGFLSVLSAQAQLLVRAIDFTAPGVAAGQAVQTKVTGTTLGGTGPTSTAPTAVVLNTTGLTGPVTIQLDNVEFAAVVGNATLVGGDGEQIVYGDDHEQYMHLGEGDDLLHGGGGNDTITSAGGNDTLYGDDGDDLVHGGEGDDWLFGGSGNDLIGGGTGDDRGFGGEGDDVLFGEEGDDTLTGNEGNDTLSGGAGNDLLFGEEGDDLLYGDEGDDTLSGGDGNDTALGGSGNDLIALGSGNDLGLGGEGNDTLFGEEGDDTLFGGAGDDVLHGGAGNDVLFADGGADTLWGGSGADVFAFGRNSGGSVVMDFEVGVDRLAFYEAGVDLGAVIRSARVEGGNTTLDVGGGNRITILGQTGNVAAWFG
ncbi:SwmB domain-containing protein [Azospirillum argentinense]